MLLTDEIERLIKENQKQLDGLFKDWNKMGVNERTLKTHEILHSMSLLHEDATSILTELVKEYPPCPIDRLESMKELIHSMKYKVGEFIVHHKDFEEMDLESLEKLLDKCMGKVMREYATYENGTKVMKTDIDKANDPATKLKEANQGINFSRKNMLECIEECCSRIEPTLEQAIEKLSDLNPEDYKSKFDIRLKRTIKEAKADFYKYLKEKARLRDPFSSLPSKDFKEQQYKELIEEFSKTELGKIWLNTSDEEKAKAIAVSEFAKDNVEMDKFFGYLAKIEILKLDVFCNPEESKKDNLRLCLQKLVEKKIPRKGNSHKVEFLIKTKGHWRAVVEVFMYRKICEGYEDFLKITDSLKLEIEETRAISRESIRKSFLNKNCAIEDWQKRTTIPNEKALNRFIEIGKETEKLLQEYYFSKGN